VQQQQGPPPGGMQEFPTPQPIDLTLHHVDKLEYEHNIWHKRVVKLESDGVYFFNHAHDTQADSWFPLLFDTVAMPVKYDTEPKAANATAASHMPHHHNIDRHHCVKVSATDPKRNYLSRTFYFVLQTEQEAQQLLQSINFNTVLLCENQNAVSEFVNRMLPLLAGQFGGQLPGDVDSLVQQQIDITRGNRQLFLPPPPQNILAPVVNQQQFVPQAIVQQPVVGAMGSPVPQGVPTGQPIPMQGPPPQGFVPQQVIIQTPPPQMQAPPQQVIVQAPGSPGVDVNVNANIGGIGVNLNVGGQPSPPL